MSRYQCNLAEHVFHFIFVVQCLSLRYLFLSFLHRCLTNSSMPRYLCAVSLQFMLIFLTCLRMFITSNASSIIHSFLLRKVPASILNRRANQNYSEFMMTGNLLTIHTMCMKPVELKTVPLLIRFHYLIVTKADAIINCKQLADSSTEKFYLRQARTSLDFTILPQPIDQAGLSLKCQSDSAKISFVSIFL